MTTFLHKILKNYSEKIYTSIGKNSGKMLLVTSIVGTTLSSLAQVCVIIFNDKYSPSQKAFMVPQELVECALSTLSLFLFIKPTQNLCLKILKTGKLLSKELVTYLEKNNLAQKRGNKDFNIELAIKDIINKIEKSDEFIKANEIDKTALLLEHKASLHNYKTLEDSTLAYVTTGAAALSTAIVIPILRNKTASFLQKKNLEIDERLKNKLNNKDLYNKNNSHIYRQPLCRI